MTRTRAITKALSKQTIAHHLDDLRDAVGRVDALADAVARSYDERRVDGDPRAEERVSHLIDAAAEAAAKALDEIDRMRATVVDHEVPSGEIWGDG